MKSEKTNTRTIAVSVVTSLMILAYGCGVFDLRGAETPDASSDGDDPLNISDILSVVSGAAGDRDYGEYFTDNAEFEDYRMISIRGEHIATMLTTLRSRANHVDWQVENIVPRPDINGQFLDGVPYIVYYGGMEICRGTADFKIEMGTDWKISYWRDRPNAQKPFFEF